MYVCRPSQPEDYAEICKFPQNPDELFAMFPSAAYPLTPEKLDANVKQRWCPTALLHGDAVAGFANLYDYEKDRQCWLGNVIVSPAHRGTGAASVLIRQMIESARDTLQVPQIALIVHSTNVPAMLLYTKLGFKPDSISKAVNNRGETIGKIAMTLPLA